MRIWSKKPRTLRPNKFFDERALAREDVLSVELARLSRVEALKTDPLEFFRQVLGVEFAIAMTLCLSGLEVAHMAFLGTWNSEVFAAITGLVGTIVGLFVGKKHDKG